MVNLPMAGSGRQEDHAPPPPPMPGTRGVEAGGGEWASSPGGNIFLFNFFLMFIFETEKDTA